MKKIYLKPATLMVNVEINNNMLAGSLRVAGSNNTTDQESDLLSGETGSSFSLWKDDEE